MNSKILLTITAVILLIVGAVWLLAPDVLYGSIGIKPDTTLAYMGRRYSAYILGLVVTVWMGRSLPNTQARRALMMGTFVAIALTSATSLYGALALGLSTWFPFISEFLLAVGFVWVLFIKPEPVVS